MQGIGEVKDLFRSLRWLGCGLVVFAALCSGSAQAQLADEYEVKAAFLFNFGEFIEWPMESASAAAPFRICVLGEDPFRENLRSSAGKRRIKGRDVEVLRPAASSEARGCQIVFISGSERRALRDILDSLRGSSVLTVGDMGGFAQSGGMIQLTVEEGRVRFEVNAEAAERAGLRISSRLLGLARIVRSG